MIQWEYRRQRRVLVYHYKKLKMSIYPQISKTNELVAINKATNLPFHITTTTGTPGSKSIVSKIYSHPIDTSETNPQLLFHRHHLLPRYKRNLSLNHHSMRRAKCPTLQPNPQSMTHPQVTLLSAPT